MPLTPYQRRALRKAPGTNRVGKAMALAHVNQYELAAAIGLTQPYISDVATGRHGTITVKNAYAFARFFGCSIEDLFPAHWPEHSVAS